MNSDYRQRFLMPILLPVGGLVFIGIVVFAFSRILLAVPHTVASTIAIAGAAAILVVATMIAARRTSKAIHGPLVAILLALVVVCGIGAGRMSASGESATSAQEGTVETGVEGGAAAGASAVKVVAKAIAFDKKELALKAGVENKIELDNEDAGTQHNVAIYTDESAATPLFVGDLFAGAKKMTYTVKPLEAGSYYFRCDVHPNMNGTVKVA